MRKEISKFDGLISIQKSCKRKIKQTKKRTKQQRIN